MKNIAIIGAGISGLTSAYLLSQKHNVTVFEKQKNIGGHTATVDVELNDTNYAIDTGFIVFNDRTYPNFLELLDQIGVKKQETEMSFSVKNANTNFEYNGHNINTLFAQRLNFFKPKFWSLIRDILRFNKTCTALAHTNLNGEVRSLGDFLDEQGFGEGFCDNYLLPMGAAIWSTSTKEVRDFQLKFFIRFFHNHGLLSISNRPQWYVIPGGSRSYLSPLCKRFERNIKTNADIAGVTRLAQQVVIHFNDNTSQIFDEVIFACHSDQALALLKDSTPLEQEILGGMPYADNDVVLHVDESILPVSKRAWASWNYHLSAEQNNKSCVTYNMNILQGIDAPKTFCVTLNQTESIDKDKILRRFTYAHPVFNQRSQNAQQRRAEICGQQHTHFAGAYWLNGFHEDGVNSAIDVAKRFNCYL